MSQPPSIICLHGVGLWPGLFDSLDLGRSRIAIVRPGYASVPLVADLAAQVGFVADLVASSAPAVLVGVSGGATLALACASREPDGLDAVISHEPLIGHLEPEIDDRVRDAADRLEADPGIDAATSFLSELYGVSSWGNMPDHARAWASDHVDVVCREVRHFSEYQPSRSEIQHLRVPHLTTVGQLSSPARHRVAALLGDGSSQVATIADSGHHVLVEQPDTFAQIIRQFLSEVT